MENDGKNLFDALFYLNMVNSLNDTRILEEISSRIDEEKHEFFEVHQRVKIKMMTFDFFGAIQSLKGLMDRQNKFEDYLKKIIDEITFIRDGTKNKFLNLINNKFPEIRIQILEEIQLIKKFESMVPQELIELSRRAREEMERKSKG